MHGQCWSQRLKGRAAQLFAEKRPWQPAAVLSSPEVLELHKGLLDEGRDLVDRVVIGHLLHMLYSRARFSDLLAVQSLELDDEGQFRCTRAQRMQTAGQNSCPSLQWQLELMASLGPRPT